MIIIKQYDYIIVGSGLFGSIFAFEATRRGKKCLVLDKRSHTGGNIHCIEKEGIHIHQYGAHIFHTSSKVIWDYVNQFADFNNYVNSPVANFRGEIYNMPFNMNTFNKIWGVTTPEQAKMKIAEQRGEIKGEPSTLEEQAISIVGRDIYEKLIKGYTEKQWGRACEELPAFIIKRLPVRYTYDNNYFNDRYQGIPIGGYNVITEKLLTGSDIKLNTNFLDQPDYWFGIAGKIVYTGMIDSYFEQKYGRLEYRSLRFDTERIESDNYQGVSVMNFTDIETPYTRIIEHKHFEFGEQSFTYITREYPCNLFETQEPYYPVNDEQNNCLFQKYWNLAEKEKNVIFGGRLAEYKYYDMDKVVEVALDAIHLELGVCCG